MTEKKKETKKQTRRFSVKLPEKLRKKQKADLVKKTVSQLEEFCGADRETYQMLVNTLTLDPRKIGTTIKEAIENAKKAEKEKDVVKTRVWYRIAGSLAIYEGDTKRAVEYFTACQKLAPNEEFTFLKNPQKAVDKAQEYYKKYLGS